MKYATLAALLIFLALPQGRLFCQQRADGLPISLQVNTSVNLPGGVVEFTGTSNSLDAAPGTIFLEVVTPAGKTDQLSARADNETGNYFVKYKPLTLGEYTVTAYAADRKQSATASFTVAAPVAVQQTMDAFDEAREQAMDALSNFTAQTISTLAAEEDVAKTKQMLEKTKANLQQFDGQWKQMEGAVKTLQQLCDKHPEVSGAAAASLGQLASKLDESSALLRQVQQDLGSSQGPVVDECSKLYHVSEGCAAFSTAMNLASGGLVAIGTSIFVDKVWPKIEENIAPKQFDATDNFLFKQAGKAGLTAADGLDQLQTHSFRAGVAGDLLQFISDEMFKKYCTEYKGPIKGVYGVTMRNEGKTWLEYQLTYEGRISVFCRKDKAGSSTPKMSGYLEGNVTNMQFTDDVWAVEDHSEWDEIKYQRIAAPVLPFTAADNDPGFGAVARMAAPGSFYFPLQAQLVEGKMVIRLMPARNDFTEAFANRTVMVVRAKEEPHNLDGAVFQYPIEKAEFILTRTMRMPEKSPTVTLEMKTQNGITSTEKDFSRSEKPGNDTEVDFSLHVKISNE